MLGLRDIMDEPALLVPEWERKKVVPALRDLYDQIWVYGLPQICDPLEGIDLPKSVRRKMIYTGYLHRTLPTGPSTSAPLAKIDEPYLLVTTGGGGDGEDVIDWVLRAYENDPNQPHPALLVLGPFMHSDRQSDFLARAAKLDNVEAITFDAQMEHLMARAIGVVRHGRLQHVLRDPVLRQAGTDHSAHAASHGTVSPRDAGQGIRPRLDAGG